MGYDSPIKDEDPSKGDFHQYVLAIDKDYQPDIASKFMPDESLSEGVAPKLA